MKIAQSHIQMQSCHHFQLEQSKQETLRTWIGNERPAFENSPAKAANDQSSDGGDRLTLSETAMRHYLQQSRQENALGERSDLHASGEDPKLTAMRLILEAMTGKKIEIDTLEAYGNGVGVSAASLADQAPNPAAPPRAGWGLEYDFHEVTAEHEEMTFAAAGEVETADGRHLLVSMELAMSRDFVQSRDIQVRAGDAVLVDPLVVNFAGQAPSLTDQKVAFDLNADGISEQISFVGPGSGLLFLDRDQDGQATDGSELFGPASGDGFAELARLDSDANGWLDDNDPMFAQLKLWAKGYAQSTTDSVFSSSGNLEAAGDDYVVSLKEVGIGAIWLSDQATPFSLNDQQNQQRGQVASSGLFLREDGSAGSIQEILLVV